MDSDRFANMLVSRYEKVGDDIDFFFKAKLQANIYLSEDTNLRLSEIQDELKDIRVAGNMHIMGLSDATERRIEVFHEAAETFWDTKKKRKERLDSIRDSLREELLSFLIHKEK